MLHTLWRLISLHLKPNYVNRYSDQFYWKTGAQLRNYCRANISRSATIFSLSSGNGKAGVAVIRISGANASQVIHSMARMQNPPPERTVTLRQLFDPQSGDLLDKGLLLWFKSPASFTGEDCCELHVHGGLAVIKSILTALSKLEGFRQSMPGEFTKRAFLNGKLDLTSVEGIADLIQAETEAQRRQALRQADGELHKLYTNWRQRILKAVAHVEAFIDFSEDENIEEGILEHVHVEVSNCLLAIKQHLADGRRGERLRSGVHVAIIGSPNVGKSSLLNLLCRRPAAIVSDIAGTTRDVVECAVDIGGYPVLICDTAGLRDSEDKIEKEGIHRAIDRAQTADLVILILDSTELQEKNLDVDAIVTCTIGKLGIDVKQSSQDRCQPLTKYSNQNGSVANILVAVNKIDLVDTNWCNPTSTRFSIVPLSCISGQGMDNLIRMLSLKLETLCASSSREAPHLTQTRHREHLSLCIQHLEGYLNKMDTDIVLGARELRNGIRQLGKITGEVTTEHILDVIFQDFCIGK